MTPIADNPWFYQALLRQIVLAMDANKLSVLVHTDKLGLNLWMCKVGKYKDEYH